MNIETLIERAREALGRIAKDVRPQDLQRHIGQLDTLLDDIELEHKHETRSYGMALGAMAMEARKR